MCFRHACLFTGILALAACSNAPVPHDPSALSFALNPQWQYAEKTATGDHRELGWLAQLDSPALYTLVDQVIDGNPNLNILRQRLAVAGFEVTRVRTDRLPSIDANLSSERSVGVPGQPEGNLSTLELDTSWELDLWGRRASLEQAARIRQISAQQNFQYEVFSIVAQITQLWLTFVEQSQLVELNRQAIANWQRIRTSVGRDYRGGIASAGDFQAVEIDFANANVEFYLSQRQLGETTRQLKVLIGAYPDDRAGDWLAELPAMPDIIALEAPATLLMTRPDLLSASADLAAADAEAEAAYRALYPNVTLQLVPQLLSGEFARFSNTERVFSAEIGVLQTVFSRNRLIAEKDIALSAAVQAFWAYNQAVLLAYRELEQVLHNGIQLKKEVEAARQARRSARLAARFDRDAYRQGLKSLADYLFSERRAIDTSKLYLGKQAQSLRNWVALQLALGRPYQT